MDIHKNARLTPHGRAHLTAGMRGGLTAKAAARAAGVSPPTARKWEKRFEAEGGAGLQDRSSRPRRLYRPTPPEAVERTAGRLWLARLSMTTISPGASEGTRNRCTHRAKLPPLTGWSSAQGASIRPQRKAARNVMVRQCP